MKRALIAALLSMAMAIPAHAQPCISTDMPDIHPLGMSWIIADFSMYVAEQQHEVVVAENATVSKNETVEEGNDYDLLAQLIYAEARGGSDEMQHAVGSVVLNRIRSERFPDTMEEVIYQEGQYQSAPYLGETNEECRQVAADLIENGATIPEKCVWCAEFPQGEGTYAVIGNQYVCY